MPKRKKPEAMPGIPMEMPMKMRAEEKRDRAEMDMRTLREADAIKRDRARMAECKKMAKMDARMMGKR